LKTLNNYDHREHFIEDGKTHDGHIHRPRSLTVIQSLTEDIQAFEHYIDLVQDFLVELKQNASDPEIRKRAELLCLPPTQIINVDTRNPCNGS